jgi:hypothetical protein
MINEARASHIAEEVIFGGSFVTARPEPNDFDCIVVLRTGTSYETLQPFQRWVADTREASRRYHGDIFVARANHPTLVIYCDFFAINRHGKQVSLVEVTL